jgi:predicted metal-dependent HD superfamily phosphohydrolase
VNLRQQFETTIGALASNASIGLKISECFGVLEAAYGSPSRVYHGWGHIEHCLEELYTRGLGPNPVVELALFYHDAVYEVGRNDNELLSAELLRKHAHPLGLSQKTATEAYGLIMATQHKTPPQAPLEKLIADIDLCSLGKSQEEFKKNSEELRKEWSPFPNADYLAGQQKFLTEFLKRAEAGTLYHTPLFQRLYTAQAILNLRQELAELNALHG